MEEKDFSATEKELVLSDQLLLVQLKNALQKLKYELGQHQEGKKYDDLLEQLNKQIGNDLEVKNAGKEIIANYYDKLMELMPSIERDGSNPFTFGRNNPQQMYYSVLADISRIKNAQEVEQLSITALSFYTRFGIGGVYERLLKNAHVA